MKEATKQWLWSLVTFGAIVSFLIFIINGAGIFIGKFIVYILSIVNPVATFLIKVVSYVITITMLYYTLLILSSIFSGIMLVRTIKEKLEGLKKK